MTAGSATIKAIEATAVHKIQSGQVIVNLCSVAKELVENSLDAGATSIEVRFKNQGLDAVEVQDNGSGIAPQNYASLALKHYTSKLSTYDDLETLQTFGFRGEALSSLCALSHFSVTTCLAADVPKGTKLTFETSGRLGPTSVVAAQVGTTVTVENLFWNLPVRRRELERNIKREWGKVISLLNQYACVQTGVRFTVSQQPSKGKRVVLFATKGNASTRDNIINVFGAKTMGALIQLDLALALEPTRDATSSKWMASTAAISATKDGGEAGTINRTIRVCGYVSRPAHGQGRQTPDRQMFYVNGRPCKLPQFAQLFGEVYRTYNASQSPFIFADIQLDTHLYDVNVSPDKQTILLHDQGRMLDNLRESLIELFEKQEITVPVSQLTSQKITSFKKPPSKHANGAVPAPSSDIADNNMAGVAAPVTETRSPQSLKLEPESTATTDATGSALSEVGVGAADDKVRLPGLIGSFALDGNRTEAKKEAAAVETVSNEHGIDQPAESRDGSAEPIIEEDDRQIHTLSSPSPGRRQQPSVAESVVHSPGFRKRTSHELAAVTVGDETVTTHIVLSPAKRQKTATTSGARAAAIGQTSQRKRKTKAPLPSFGGRLTQMFSAAGGSLERDGSALGTENDEIDSEESVSEEEHQGEEEEEEDDEEVEDDGIKAYEEEEEEEETGAENNMDLEDEENHDYMSDNQDGHDSSSLRIANNLHPLLEDGDEVESIINDDRKEEKENDQNGDDRSEENRDDEEAEAEIDEERGSESQNGFMSSIPGGDLDRRSLLFLKSGGSKKRYGTLTLVQVLRIDEADVQKKALSWQGPSSKSTLPALRESGAGERASDDQLHQPGATDLNDAHAEDKLALTIAKSDFAKMRVVGQFNLGFILAVRQANRAKKAKTTATAMTNDGTHSLESADHDHDHKDDELFIVDQHASDEKYNFERLQARTVVQSQRLVQPKRLDLTAVEEEIVIEHQAALAANGFSVQVVLDGTAPVGARCRLLTLPLSRETTFDLADLEELIALLGEGAGTGVTAVPRPSKVRKMFAMRACRSSIMVGRALTRQQMAGVLAHMGEMDKPWNCPHGRPTMRHLCSLGAAWDGDRTWHEHSEPDAGPTDWAAFLRKRRKQE